MYIDKYFNKFTSLIIDQFRYGAKKYGSTDARESTDILFDIYGKNWLIGTCDKYCHRFLNVGREKDLLKISAYMYILWLKRGFFIKKQGLSEALDTNIDNKEGNYEEFVEKATKLYMFSKKKLENVFSQEYSKNPIKIISREFESWAKIEFKDIEESSIFVVFCLSYIIWFNNFKDSKVNDTDTYNSSDKKENENDTI